MVEVEVRVDDQVNAVHIEVPLAVQWLNAGVHVCDRRVQSGQSGVDEHSRVWVFDHVHVDRHALVLRQKVCNANWCDGDLSGMGHDDRLADNPRGRTAPGTSQQ